MKNELLSENKLNNIVSRIPEWKIDQNKLKRTFKFHSFIEAFGFISKIALISESLGHHPEWSNVYGTVNILLTTHDLGGISELDVSLAESIDSLI